MCNGSLAEADRILGRPSTSVNVKLREQDIDITAQVSVHR
jgi:hypothetical protein